MDQVIQSTLPAGISQATLTRWLSDAQNREALLQSVVQRFEQRHKQSLETFEARLNRGEGAEHPDWEDSIEWRNAFETLQQTRLMRRLWEWVLHSITPSRA
ncbi:MAG: hypothetical protein FJ009_12155 [Chloroflexi bacterium]|nr:hypothetical protein [Chloroflexota bacterium]